MATASGRCRKRNGETASAAKSVGSVGAVLPASVGRVAAAGGGHRSCRRADLLARSRCAAFGVVAMDEARVCVDGAIKRRPRSTSRKTRRQRGVAAVGAGVP